MIATSQLELKVRISLQAPKAAFAQTKECDYHEDIASTTSYWIWGIYARKDPTSLAWGLAYCGRMPYLCSPSRCGGGNDHEIHY